MTAVGLLTRLNYEEDLPRHCRTPAWKTTLPQMKLAALHMALSRLDIAVNFLFQEKGNFLLAVNVLKLGSLFVQWEVLVSLHLVVFS